MFFGAKWYYAFLRKHKNKMCIHNIVFPIRILMALFSLLQLNKYLYISLFLSVLFIFIMILLFNKFFAYNVSDFTGMSIFEMFLDSLNICM